MSQPPANRKPETPREISARFEGQAPGEILRWGLETFAGAAAGDASRAGIAMATGFGPEGVVLMHLLSRIDRQATVFYLDTDLLFDETYALRDELEARLGLRFTRVHGLSLEDQASEHGPALWSHNPDQCCQLRKVAPLRRYLASKRAWITAIRREQTPARANAGLVEWDRANGLVKLNPLAAWTSAQVWAYLYDHDLPYNPLHDQGYPSLGCWPCTRAVSEGEDARAGRWPGLAKNECGIHLSLPQPAAV